MAAESQRTIRQLFDAASELPPAERVAWLERQQIADPSVLAAVRNLLRAANSSSGFLEKPAIHRPQPVEREGRRIGPYKILRELGSGGMGIVYQCVRDDSVFQRVAALKIVRPEFGSGPMLDKFRQERQTLAALDHPNIARILDGGTTDDGLPYLVMDYVDGEPIDLFCNRRSASLTQRLNLMQQMAKAVDYLHKNHVLHRDLKPANVLVTGGGLVKLLDFGIAKPLSPAYEATATTLPLMTPGFASPEQVLSQPSGPQSDVYSLGAILYVLLAGRPPLDLQGKPVAEVIDLVAHRDPAPVSTAVDAGLSIPVTLAAWKASLTGELDRIVAMALRKEPARRYQTALDLASDLRRFQLGEPILATKNTPIYLASRYVRRHRVSVVAGLIVAASLSFAAAAGGRMYFLYKEVNDLRAQQAVAQRAFERARAEDSAQLDSRQVLEQIQEVESDYQVVQPMLSSRLAPRHEIARLAIDSVSYLNDLAPVAVASPESTHALADAYLSVSRLQWSGAGESLHDPAAAIATGREALAQITPALADPQVRAEALRAIGDLQRQVVSATGNAPAPR
jgi:serine/threonine protein kinase